MAKIGVFLLKKPFFKEKPRDCRGFLGAVMAFFRVFSLFFKTCRGYKAGAIRHGSIAFVAKSLQFGSL